MCHFERPLTLECPTCVVSTLESMSMASASCMSACLQLRICAFQVEWLSWLHVKSMSAFTFHGSPTFCVTGLKRGPRFSGEHRHQLPERPTRMRGALRHKWQYVSSHPRPVHLCHDACQEPSVMRGPLMKQGERKSRGGCLHPIKYKHCKDAKFCRWELTADVVHLCFKILIFNCIRLPIYRRTVKSNCKKTEWKKTRNWENDSDRK